MKAYINDVDKVAFVVTDSVEEACQMGRWFTRDHSDLVAMDWLLVCKEPSERLDSPGRRGVEVDGVDGLADAIREGPPCTHSCSQHPKREAAG